MPEAVPTGGPSLFQTLIEGGEEEVRGPDVPVEPQLQPAGLSAILQLLSRVQSLEATVNRFQREARLRVVEPAEPQGPAVIPAHEHEPDLHEHPPPVDTGPFEDLIDSARASLRTAIELSPTLRSFEEQVKNLEGVTWTRHVIIAWRNLGGS